MAAPTNPGPIANLGPASIQADEGRVHLRVGGSLGLWPIARKVLQFDPLILRHDQLVHRLMAGSAAKRVLWTVVHLEESIDHLSRWTHSTIRRSDSRPRPGALVALGIASGDEVLNDGTVTLRNNRRSVHAVPRKAISVQTIIEHRVGREWRRRGRINAPLQLHCQSGGSFIDDTT